MLSKDVVNKEIIYSMLLVMSGILLEKTGKMGIKLYLSQLAGLLQFLFNWHEPEFL